MGGVLANEFIAYSFDPAHGFLGILSGPGIHAGHVVIRRAQLLRIGQALEKRGRPARELEKPSPVTTGKTPDGDPILAVDCIGAGVSDNVMMTSDGARKLLNVDVTPVRWTIIGIQD